MKFLKHPEQMTPGSFWRVRDKGALVYLNHGLDWENSHYHGPTVSIKWGTSLYYEAGPNDIDFELGSTYFLTELQETGSGMLIAKFLIGEKNITTELYVSFWDTVFQLVRKTVDPVCQPQSKLLFGKYPVESFKKLV